MHIKGVSVEENSKMSGCSIDNRLRRQNPVSARRPPRLRLGSRIPAVRDHSLTDQTRHHKTKSWHGSGGMPDAGTDDVSRSKSFENDPDDIRSNNPDTNFNRPLIHHQRHNLKNRFQLLKTLGEGTYGKVKLAAECSTGEHAAIKYIKKTKIHDEADLTRIRREIQILSSLQHNHIVNIREVFEKKDKIVLVMDYAQGGELYDYLNKSARLTENEARRIFRQIVSAIHYCHQNGIVHRDLKLENIILDDGGNVKIADFGLANYFSYDKTLETFCGSPLYASPEIVNGKSYHGPEVDVWSLGVILYTLVYGAMPFESNSLVSLKQQISQGNYAQPSQPSDAAGLIRHMLTVTPSRRASMEDALCHWWVNFGHSIMPNGAPYCPDDQSHTRRSNNSNTSTIRPIHSHSLSAPVVSSTAAPLVPTFIHQRNQSSISSDSDLELDFKPSRWSKSAVLDKSSRQSPSTDGNSSSSSSSFACPSYTDDSDVLTKDVESLVGPDNQVPQAVFEILKDCSSKTLACLLGTDKISTGFDLPQQSISSVSTNSLPEKTEIDKVNSSVFDSERKPKRGILKRKGKFSGGDSGCAMPEEMSVRPDENFVPKSGNLPKRLPSFRGEAHGIFASKHRISQLLQGENKEDNYNSAMPLPNVSSSELYSQTPPISNQQPLSPQKQHCHQDDHFLLQQQPLNANSMYNINSSVLSDQESAISAMLDGNKNLSPTSTISTMSSQHTPPRTNLLKTSSSSTPCLNFISQQPPSLTTSPTTPNNIYSVQNDNTNTNCVSTPLVKDSTKVIRRPKSILKASKSSQLEEARNRLSVSSIGSNSSADFLDLSYDSGDSDHFINLRNLSSPDDNLNVETSPPDSICGGERASICLEEDFENLKIGYQDLENSQLLEPRNSVEMVAMEKAEVHVIPTSTQAIFSEVESPMLYRLTREAKDLTLH